MSSLTSWHLWMVLYEHECTSMSLRPCFQFLTTKNFIFRKITVTTFYFDLSFFFWNRTILYWLDSRPFPLSCHSPSHAAAAATVTALLPFYVYFSGQQQEEQWCYQQHCAEFPGKMSAAEDAGQSLPADVQREGAQHSFAPPISPATLWCQGAPAWLSPSISSLPPPPHPPHSLSPSIASLSFIPHSSLASYFLFKKFDSGPVCQGHYIVRFAYNTVWLHRSFLNKWISIIIFSYNFIVWPP